MNKLHIDKINKIAEILKTISHPIRLQIIEELMINEKLSVNQLLAAIDPNMDQPLISHHLIKMKDRGVLLSEKSGNSVFYYLTDRNLCGIFDCMEKCKF